MRIHSFIGHPSEMYSLLSRDPNTLREELSALSTVTFADLKWLERSADREIRRALRDEPNNTSLKQLKKADFSHTDVKGLESVLKQTLAEAIVPKNLLLGLQAFQERALPRLIELNAYSLRLPIAPDVSEECLDMISISEEMADELTWATDGTPRVWRTPFVEMLNNLVNKSASEHSGYTPSVIGEATEFIKKHDTVQLRNELRQAYHLGVDTAHELQAEMFPAEPSSPLLSCSMKFPWSIKRLKSEQKLVFSWRQL